MPPTESMTIEQAARALQVSESHVRRLIKRKYIAVIYLGRRMPRIKTEIIQKLKTEGLPYYHDTIRPT